ncbi:MAG: ATP phosphoribosyltransferase regulatory subunit [Cyanobacteria bacterium P01_H01_bin.15]
MIYQPPAGARDLLPREVIHKGWINDRLQTVFHQWGYQRLVTSSIESVETLVAGGTIEQDSIIQLANIGGDLGLRPDITVSIARTAVMRLGNSIPQRLCYRGNVFRRPPLSQQASALEIYQAGVELLFVGGIRADAEILLLLADCLQTLQLTNTQIVLGEAGLTQSLLEGFGADQRVVIRACLASLDRVSLEKHFDQWALESAQRDLALTLFELRGQPHEVLSRLQKLPLNADSQVRSQNLQNLLDLVEDCSTLELPLTLDLSVPHAFGYYTGISFEVVSLEPTCRVLAQGGRYDDLLSSYHPSGQGGPGVGFSFSIDELYDAMRTSYLLTEKTLVPDWLVVPTTEKAMAAAFRHAQEIRQGGPQIQVELALDQRSSAEIRQAAQEKGIKQIAWIDEQGIVQVESTSTSS